MRARRFHPSVDRLDLRITPSDLIPITSACLFIGSSVMETGGSTTDPGGQGLMPGQTDDCTSAWLVAGNSQVASQAILEPPVEPSYVVVMPVATVAAD